MYLSLFRSSFIHIALSYCLLSSDITMQELLEHFLTDLVITICFGFCLSGDVLISPSHLKDHFAGYRIAAWQIFFSFNILNTVAHSLLSSKVYDEKPTNNIIVEYWSVTSHFSLTVFKFLCLSFESLIIICFYADFLKFIICGVC